MNELFDHIKYNIFTIRISKKDIIENNIDTQADYIASRMKDFAMNINEFNIGQVVLDSDKKECSITDMSLNSIQLFLNKKSKNGVNCHQWFDMREFNKRFRVK